MLVAEGDKVRDTVLAVVGDNVGGIVLIVGERVGEIVLTVEADGAASLSLMVRLSATPATARTRAMATMQPMHSLFQWSNLALAGLDCGGCSSFSSYSSQLTGVVEASILRTARCFTI